MDRFIRIFAFLCLTLVMGCATPLERCLASADAELARFDALIAETEANLARGYALKPVAVPKSYLVPCLIDGRRGFCQDRFIDIERKPEAIDPLAEQRKLAELRKRRAEAVSMAAAMRTACLETYPAQ